jgi:hypothetical protein
MYATEFFFCPPPKTGLKDIQSSFNRLLMYFNPSFSGSFKVDPSAKDFITLIRLGILISSWGLTVINVMSFDL